MTPSPVLLVDGTVLTLDAAATVRRGCDVLLRDGRIADLGVGLERPPGAMVVDAAGCLVIPGLVQGHVHLGQTFFRGLAEDRRLLAWLRDRIWPLEAAHDDESAYWCGLLGAVECLLGGTTTIQDIGIGPGTRGLLRAIGDSRIRAVAGKCLMDVGDGMPAALCEETDRTLADTESLGTGLPEAADAERLSYAINPRFILSCSDHLWHGVQQLATRHSWPVHTHALEQQDETALVRQLKGGRDEVAYFEDYGILDVDLRLAHGVWLEEGHVARIANRRVSVVHCPSSNLKLGSGVADVVGLRRASVTVGLGCDGAACANHFDAFEEMRLAAHLQKLKHGPDAFSGLDAMRLATSEGARAVGLGHAVGSLEVGAASGRRGAGLRTAGALGGAARGPTRHRGLQRWSWRGPSRFRRW